MFVLQDLARTQWHKTSKQEKVTDRGFKIWEVKGSGVFVEQEMDFFCFFYIFWDRAFWFDFFLGSKNGFDRKMWFESSVEYLQKAQKF